MPGDRGKQMPPCEAVIAEAAAARGLIFFPTAIAAFTGRCDPASEKLIRILWS